MDLGSLLTLGAFALILAFCGKYAISFAITLFRPRGKDLKITHQVKNIEADNPNEAMRAAYKALPEEYKDDKKASVDKIFMKRDDKEGG